MQVPGHSTDHVHNVTSFHTQHIHTLTWQLTPSYIRLALGSVILILITFRVFHYFTSELPPLGSGLKPLPGPRSTLPYIGRVHDVDRMHAWDAMHRFSKEYNGLFSCTMGGETHIWSAREDVAQDLLVKNAALSSARADLGAYPNVTQEYKYLPLMGFTDAFHRQRRFAQMMMTRNINNKYYGYMTLEMKRFMHQMLENSSDFFELTHVFCARISSRLAYGSPESAPAHKENAGTFISQLGPSGPVPNLLPPLQNLPEWLIPGKQGVRVRQEQEAKLWKDLFQTSKQAHEKEKGQKTYVSASLEAKESGESGRLLFENEDEARHAVGMLCIVAIFTIGGPATLFIMAMILHPQWQDKVRKEIDEAVGEGMLDLKHTPLVPTLRAAIKEAVRWKSTVPLGVPRLLTEDYEFEGYHFPKGAVVHILDIAMSQDPERYVDPASYNPGRWLDEDSPNFKAPLTEFPRLKGHHIFGRGKRACPGQDFAESELIIFCGNLLKFFNLSPARGKEGQPLWPSPDKWTTHVIGGPLPFECEIKIRDNSKLEAVRSMYEEAFPQDL